MDGVMYVVVEMKSGVLWTRQLYEYESSHWWRPKLEYIIACSSLIGAAPQNILDL